MSFPDQAAPALFPGIMAAPINTRKTGTSVSSRRFKQETFTSELRDNLPKGATRIIGHLSHLHVNIVVDHHGGAHRPSIVIDAPEGKARRSSAFSRESPSGPPVTKK